MKENRTVPLRRDRLGFSTLARQAPGVEERAGDPDGATWVAEKMLFVNWRDKERRTNPPANFLFSESVRRQRTAVAFHRGATDSIKRATILREGYLGQTLRKVRFRDVNLEDTFFDSLKAQYQEFEEWFRRKANELTYVIYDDADGSVRGFLYLKVEDGPIEDVDPPLPAKKRLKVGTMKVQARGTKLGERLLKRIFDHAILEGVNEVYVTVFDTHDTLIKLFERYGFFNSAIKHTPNGDESVLVREIDDDFVDVIYSYPRFRINSNKNWLLAIYPEYHTKLFPDSILRGENPDDEQDVAHTNTIHKVYIGHISLSRMTRGDIVAIYRTTDKPGLAKYRSVISSICIVEETKNRKDFPTVDSFIDFALNHSVFSDDELRSMYLSEKRIYAVKMTYNVALPRRPNRERLLNEVGITEYPRWDFRPLSDNQMQRILELGEVNEGFIVYQT